MKQTLQDLQVQFSEPIPIFCDNTSAINIPKYLVIHSKIKQILIKYHFVREQVAEKNIKLEYVGTVDPTTYTYLQVSEKSLQPHKVWLVAGNSEKGLSH